jgi:hypothetical protein
MRILNLLLVPVGVGVGLIVWAIYAHADGMLDAGLLLVFFGGLIWSNALFVYGNTRLGHKLFALYKEGTQVRIVDRPALEGIQPKRRFMGKLTDDQLRCAGMRATVQRVESDIFRGRAYCLEGAPGLWREEYLLPANGHSSGSGSAATPIRTLSSAWTPLCKVSFAIWIPVLLMWLASESSPRRPVGAMLGVIGVAAYESYVGLRLKRVRMNGHVLYIYDYTSEVTVPLAEVARVTETRWDGLHRVTIYFARPTAAGTKVTFMPRLPSFWWTHYPVVEKISEAADRCRAETARPPNQRLQRRAHRAG